MIDEKVLIERLKNEKKYCSYHPHTRDETINKAISIANQLAEEQNNGWIPCSERLPEDDEDKEYFLVCDNNADVFIAYFKNGKWYYDTMDGEMHMVVVLAWMPLPAPYEQKDCNTCVNNTDFDEVDNGCYMCCKGYENNYHPKGGVKDEV